MPIVRRGLAFIALWGCLIPTFSRTAYADEPPVSFLDGSIDLAQSEQVADSRYWQPVIDGCAQRFWTGGVETTFLAPIMSGITTRTLVVNTSGTPDGVEVIDDLGLEMMTFAPRVWVGYNLGNGWGFTGRFWYLSDTQTDQGSFDLTGGEIAFEGQNRLQQYTVDLEVTCDFECGDWLMQATCGVRYAAIEYNAQLTETGDFTSTLVSGHAESDRSFQGTGSTFSLNGRCPWWQNSAMHWIWNARGSVIYGNARYNTTAATEVLDGLGWQVSGISGASRFDDTLFIGEIQAGVQWEHRLQSTPASAFFRCVLEYQYWGGIDDVDLGVGVVTSALGAGVGAQANARGINLDLIGLSIGAGLAW